MRRKVLLLVLCLALVAAGIAAAVALPALHHDVACAVSVFPPVVSPGGTVDVTVTVWNLGNIDDSCLATVGTHLMGRTITLTKDVWLPIHGSASITKTIPVPAKAPAGEYPIGVAVRLQPDPRADEDLTNNAAEGYIVVGQSNIVGPPAE